MKRAGPEEPEDDGGPLFGEVSARTSSGVIRWRPLTKEQAGWTFDHLGNPVEPRASKETFRDRLAEHFKARPGEWIGGLELARIWGRVRMAQ